MGPPRQVAPLSLVWKRPIDVAAYHFPGRTRTSDTREASSPRTYVGLLTIFRAPALRTGFGAIFSVNTTFSGDQAAFGLRTGSGIVKIPRFVPATSEPFSL